MVDLINTTGAAAINYIKKIKNKIGII